MQGSFVAYLVLIVLYSFPLNVLCNPLRDARYVSANVAQNETQNDIPTATRNADDQINSYRVPPGRYVPQLYGADRGKYVQDDSGKYHHIRIPYDGGYGDRGLKYEHDIRGKFGLPPQLLSLGPNDHLRFMIDFNYNGTGWQIIQFEWTRDGEDEHYNYLHENQLWDSTRDAISANGMKSTYGMEATYQTAGIENNDSVDMAGVAEAVKAAEAEQIPTNGDGAVSNGEAEAVEGSTDDADSTNVHVDGQYKDTIYNVTYTSTNDQHQEYKQDVRDAIAEVLDYIQRNIIPTLN